MTRPTKIVMTILMLAFVIVPSHVGAGEAPDEDVEKWTYSVTAGSSAPIIVRTVVDFVADLAPPCDAATFCSATITACITACIADSGGSWAYAECEITNDMCRVTCKCEA